MLSEVVNEKKRVEQVFDMVKQLESDAEILAHWAKYLCVLTSGFVENALRILLTNYVSNKASPVVASFVESRVKRIANLNEEKICQLLGSFSRDWRERFVQQRTQAQKAAIDSVLANRHNIAHGRSVGLSLSRMRGYYEEIACAVKLIDEECINATHPTRKVS